MKPGNRAVYPGLSFDFIKGVPLRSKQLTRVCCVSRLRQCVRPMTFKDVDDAIAQVNSTVYGLSSGVCTKRLDDIMRFLRELNLGSVNVWEVPGYRLEVTPFGGIKDSGTGVKEGVQECCKAFTNVKTYSLPW